MKACRKSAVGSVLLGLAIVACTPVDARRNVSFWYAPASYGGSDIDAVVRVLANHSNTVSSVMLYCGHSIGAGGSLLFDSKNGALCTGTGPNDKSSLVNRLKAIGIVPEIVLNSGTNDVKDYRSFWANESMVSALASAVQSIGAGGLNFDLEPQVGSPASTPQDASTYATFLSKVRTSLKPLQARLTICVAQWSPMLSQYTVLAPAVDRLLNMETYNAMSMNGWLNGDQYGGDYTKFVNDEVPRQAAGPGLGCWPAKCGSQLCWTSTASSVAPRIARMITDNVPEVALFRLIQIQGSNWPQDWWWDGLSQFANAPIQK